MKQFDYTIKDPLGIHARPAGQFAKLAKGFGDTVVTIAKDGNAVKASQLMKVMSMAIKSGNTVTLAAEGPDEDKAIAAVREFMEANL